MVKVFNITFNNISVIWCCPYQISSLTKIQIKVNNNVIAYLDVALFLQQKKNIMYILINGVGVMVFNATFFESFIDLILIRVEQNLGLF
jgi:hypothetical protein